MNKADSAERQMEVVAIAIGYAVIRWNGLCETLGILFGAILYPGVPIPRIAQAIWHSSVNDRTQRKMLLATTKERQQDVGTVFPTLYEDIEWLCKKIDHLSEYRNDLVHAPLTFELDPNDLSKSKRMIASNFFEHPRAGRLTKRDIVKLFNDCALYSRALDLYARRIHAAMASRDADNWPVRPNLPDLDGVVADSKAKRKGEGGRKAART